MHDETARLIHTAVTVIITFLKCHEDGIEPPPSLLEAAEQSVKECGEWLNR